MSESPIPKKRCLISCLEGIHLEASRGKSLGAFNIDHTDFVQSPVFRLKRHWSFPQTELLYSLLRIKPPVFCCGQRRDAYLEERTWESNCFSHNLSIRPPAFVSTVSSLPIVPATAGNCLALGVTERIVFLFFPAYWLIISFSWIAQVIYHFLHLLSGFQNILAAVSSPFSLCPAGLYPLQAQRLML